jgi:uncharacterized protein YndB with AHSA1/START domain
MTTTAIAPDQDMISTEIFIAAPPARVFQAVTDPTQIPRWWGHHDHYRIEECEADLRVGGKWLIRGVKGDGKAFHCEGEYLEIDPPRLLVQTWTCTSMGAVKTVLRWQLEAQTVHGLYPSGPHRAGTGTLVRIRHEGFAGYPAAAADHYQGWQRVLGWLRTFVENE